MWCRLAIRQALLTIWRNGFDHNHRQSRWQTVERVVYGFSQLIHCLWPTNDLLMTRPNPNTNLKRRFNKWSRWMRILYENRVCVCWLFTCERLPPQIQAERSACSGAERLKDCSHFVFHDHIARIMGPQAYPVTKALNSPEHEHLWVSI